LTAAEVSSVRPPLVQERGAGQENDSLRPLPIRSDRGVDDTAERVVDKLARLDREQMRGLVADLRLALLDAMPASEATTVETGSSDPPVHLDPVTASDAPAHGAARPEFALAIAHRSRDAQQQARRSVPRRVGAVLASGFLATVAASLLVVPAANPPARPAASAPQIASADAAATVASKLVPAVEIANAAPELPHEPVAARAAGAAAAPTTPDKGIPVSAGSLPVLAPAAGGDMAPQPQATTASSIDTRQVALNAPRQPLDSAEGRPKLRANIPMPVPSTNSEMAFRDDATGAARVQPPPIVAVAASTLSPVVEVSLPTPIIAELPPPPEPVLPVPRVAMTEQPQQSPPQAAARGVAPPPTPSMAPEVVQSLIERGDHFLSLGDIASARQFYERAVEAGSAAAATGIARTFDPQFLKQIGAVGIRGDKGKALYWYRRASDGGDGAATERMHALLAETPS